MIRHPLIEFIAGDDWEIMATLLDETGTPYDLSQPSTIKWRLFNQCGVAVNDTDAQIAIINPSGGIVSVLIPASVTTDVGGGLYTDALRLTMAGETGTLLMGPIEVVGDPWRLVMAVSSSVAVQKDERSGLQNRLRVVRSA